MAVYKTKSLSNKFSNQQIADKCFVTGFISFERAIKETIEFNGLTKIPVGYRVTEQGIEILYE